MGTMMKDQRVIMDLTQSSDEEAERTLESPSTLHPVVTGNEAPRSRGKSTNLPLNLGFMGLTKIICRM